jgi:uncharacterized repeat protein (TIGR03806 family)
MNTFINIIRWCRSINNLCYSLVIGMSALLVAVSATAQAPKSTDFQRTVVAEGLDLPMEFEISADGRAFVVSKCGKFYGWKLDAGVATVTSTVPNVRCVFEDGLLSVALDPNFTQNGFIYFQYTSPGSKTRVSRFTVNANNALVVGSESILLEWITGNEAHGHMGGSLKFDKSGNLLITTGDNNAASGYFSEGAQATSGNTNDLRGKVLRITPTADGKYTIPAGNLFPADATHRAEIYGMGFRNPFRINIDPLTGYAYLGDIGPDSSAASAEGPGGMDELNELRTAGNYGWPYIIGFNEPYAGFNPNNIVNNHVRNTGAKNLPAAKPALWTVRHQATMAGPVYRFNPAITNEFKLPEYYNGRLIFWDFNSSKFSTINLAAGGNPPVAEDFPLNTANFQGAIDVELDPRTHQLYVLQWGSGCCDKEPFGNGILYRFDYIGDRDNGTNVAVGGVATATSETGGNLATYAIDGNPATRWESLAADPQSLTIDLRTPITIATIIIKWEAAFSSKYVIEASVNGTTWERLVTNNNGTGNAELHMINSTTAYRYVRLTGTARASAYGHSIYEFEVFAGAQPEQPLTQFAYLNMPKTLDASFTGVPKLLSQTGVFSNTPNMTPIANLVPFAPNSQLYSDNATKARWISLPANTKVKWDAKENWIYPQGTVVVKNFDLPTNANNPATKRRLETRLLVVKADGKVYGVTYRWRADNSDADLLTTGAQQSVTITNADGTTTNQTWTFPSPTECMDCHNAQSAQILGLSTRQLNGNYTYPNGVTENQLVNWNNRNLFTPAFTNSQVPGFDKMVALNDTGALLEARVKSYLDANCAHCHGTGAGGSQWDARFNTPLSQMKIVNLATTGIRDYMADYGIANAKVVAAGAPQQSVLYIRDKSVNPNDRMPPIGRALEHKEYIAVLDQWITSLSGTPPQGKVLLSRGKPVTVSTFEGGFVGANVVDGDVLTRWGSEFSDPQWIEIDLQTPQSISEIKLVWEAAYGKNYTIQGSLDRTQWTPIVTKANGTGGVETHSNLSGTYRYVRLNGTVRGTVWGYSLFEFEIWGGSDTPVQTPAISFTSPTSGQQYNQGSAVSLQVSVSDAAWFSSGGTYRYTLDSNAAVPVANANPVSIPAPAVGQHSLRVQLYSAAGQAVGTASTTNFTVNPVIPQTPVLISQNKTVTTSAVIGGNTGAAAVDGNMGTRWESVFADNQFIQIDLGSKMKISQIVLEWEAAYGKGYVIEASDTGTGGWTELFRTTTGNGAQDALTVNGQGRYVRLTGITRGTQYGFSLWEFRVYGNSLDVVTTPTISITSPTAGQQFVQGNSVSLQVGVSDTAWFSAGGSYRYSLNNAATIRVTNATPVNLGALPVGNHSVVVTLLNAQSQVVGVNTTVNFSVITGGVTPTTPSPAKLTPIGSTASSFLGGNTVASAHDGNVATRWESAETDTQYIQLDMGKSIHFTRVVLNWEAAYGKSYVLEVSENGSTWDIVNTTTNGDGGIDTLVLDGQKGRYIRMRGVQRATGYGYSLFEFEVYGVPADANLALISFLSPVNDAVIAETEAVKFRVAITDANWFAGGGYVYYLDTNPAVRVNNLNEINLGLLPTGQHNLRISLVNSSGVEVSVPKVRKFRVSCGATCPKVLVFSKTSGFRHDSIAAGIAMVQQIAQANGYTVTASEDSSIFTTANLAQYSTIVFMNTTGDIFTTAQEAAFKTYMENGGGFVGTHSAADTEHDWDWYTDTLFAGAEFIHHGDGIPRAKVKIEKLENTLVKHIGAEWMLGDEWYFWKTNPRGVGNVEILGTLDRTSYASNYPVADHPVIFTNTVGTGRMFYTAIGHVDANFSDPNMVEMIRKAIEWTSAN